MKHNIKNRPKCIACNFGSRNWVNEWFEGFEKELRAILLYKGPPLKQEWIAEIEGQKKLVKEILGENQP